MKTSIKVIHCFFLLATPVFGQSPRIAATGPVFSASAGYTYYNLGMASSGRIGMKGSNLGLTANFSERFGMRLDLGYARAPNTFGSKRNAEVLSYLAGPVLYLNGENRMRPYVHALVGGARVKGPVKDGSGGFLGSGYVHDFSYAFGAGGEYRFSAPLAIRVGTDYVHTRFFNSSLAIRGQSDFRVVISFVYHFRLHPKRDVRTEPF